MVALWGDHYLLLLLTYGQNGNDVVIPSKPIFYRRFVDNFYSRQKLGDTVLFDRSNNYSNIKLVIELNPSKFLDTKLTNFGAYKFNVYRKNTKLPSPWTSKTPKHYKRNRINGDLHCSKRISSNFDEEIPLMKEKLIKERLITHCVSLTV